jgi:hypothetical protein
MKKIFDSIRKNGLSALLLIAAITFFAACNKDSSDNPNNNNYAGILAFNLAPDKPAVGFSVSGKSFTYSPLAFTSYTGGYQPVYPGMRSVEAYDYNNGATIATSGGNFGEKKYYSAFLVGNNGAYRTIIAEDNLDSLDASRGNAYMRYINAIPDSVSNPTVRITGGEQPVNEQAAFGFVSAFRPVTPGAASISVSNGSGINANRTITTEANKVYTVLLVGLPGSNNADSVQVRFIENGSITQ